MKIFSLFDSKAAAFMQPFFAQSAGAAQRALIDLARDSREMVARHPADFTLIEIGWFDDQTGTIGVCLHENHGTVLQMRAQADAHGSRAQVSLGLAEEKMALMERVNGAVPSVVMEAQS